MMTISVVVELRHGALRRDDAGALWLRIQKDVLARGQVLGVGEEEALVAGELFANLSSSGQMVYVEDVLIAATRSETDLIEPCAG